MSPRKPLTEEEKQVLRDRLAAAREAKKLKGGGSNREAPPAEPAPPHKAVGNLYQPWTERQWQTAPLEDCKSRLALLKGDFETGARMVGQRPDVNDPHSYKCFICSKPVVEGKWSSKQDYLNPHTQIFESVVWCSAYCVAVYSNSPRHQQALKDLMAGKVGSHREPDVVDEGAA
jgi:hypothetical protein